MQYTDGTTEQLSKSKLTPILSKEPAVGVAAQASVMSEEVFAAAAADEGATTATATEEDTFAAVATTEGAVIAAATSEEEATAAAAEADIKPLPHLWLWHKKSVEPLLN